MIDIKLNTNKLIDFVSEKYETGELDNNSLVQLIELAGKYLNLQTLANCAKNNDKCYNWAKKHKNKIELFEVKFIIDNE